MRHRIFNVWTITLLTLTLAFGGLMTYSLMARQADAYAGAEIVGNPDGAEYRALLAPASGSRVKRVIYFAAGAHTMVGANTPIASSAYCGFGGFTFYRADVYLSGTMTGTAPTAAIQWQHTIDGGTNWIDVGTWTTINATVTPASQSNTVNDHGDLALDNGSGTVVPDPAEFYGDCWRALVTFTGTGTVTANFEMAGIAK